jgi:hypothetical protein
LFKCSGPGLATHSKAFWSDVSRLPSAFYILHFAFTYPNYSTEIGIRDSTFKLQDQPKKRNRMQNEDSDLFVSKQKGMLPKGASLIKIGFPNRDDYLSPMSLPEVFWLPTLNT